MIKIGEKIKKLRDLREYSQEYMAQKLKLSVNGYGKIERDETDISLKRLEEIAAVLEVDIFRILTFDEKQIFNINARQSNLGLVHTPQLIDNEGYKDFITHLQEEITHLRAQNSALMQQNIALIELMKSK
jgi:transcriptional regulator with XRE-family HTH domain